MRKWLFAMVAVAATLYSAVAMARPLNLNEISESVCRVRVGAAGTGTCIGETPDGKSYYILTNGHVVGNSRSGTVEFFKGGYVTSKLPAKVVWTQYRRGSDIDFALLTVDKSLFGDHPPRIIPLAPEGYQVQTGNYIAAVGCPSARWAQAWEGHVINRGDSRVMFVPAPIGGQSGSGVTVLVQGKDGEWYTRVGAVLTWRITSGGLAQGGAIPIATLYSVLQNSHVPYMTPVGYHEVADETEDIGYYRRSVPRPAPAGSWGSGSCPPGSGSCPPGSSGSAPPPYNNSGSSPWRQQPPSEQPPAPGQVPPYTQPNNPYGTNPPSIGAPWPGEEAPAPAPEEAPAPAPEEAELLTPEEELALLAEKYALLEEEKAAMEEEILAVEQRRLDAIAAEKAEAVAAAEVVEAEEEAALGWWGRLKQKMNGFVGGAMMAFGIGVLIFIWSKFIKPRVIKRVDSLQDYIQGRVTEKWGKEAGEESRELMEGAEEALLGYADDFLEKTQARNQVAKSLAKGKPAQRVANGEGINRKLTVAETLEAVREAASVVGDDTVTTEVPKKVAEILSRVAADKDAAAAAKK